MKLRRGTRRASNPGRPQPASTAGQWIRVIRNVVAHDRSPIVVNDTNGVIAREEPTADAFGSLGVRAVILCPLARVANGVRGVLSVQDAGGPREWSTYELTLVDAIANEIGTAFGHTKAYTLERESVERLEALDSGEERVRLDGFARAPHPADQHHRIPRDAPRRRRRPDQPGPGRHARGHRPQQSTPTRPRRRPSHGLAPARLESTVSTSPRSPSPRSS